MNKTTPKPSAAMTASILLALTALFFTGEAFLVWLFALAILWTHFTSWRYLRAASGIWLARLLFYGGIFAFFGGRPGMGADWIFDAKTFNTIGLIAAAETLLQAWREPPEGLRFQPLEILMSGIIFLAACNTYDDRYIRFFAPLYIASTLLALRDVRERKPQTHRIWFLQLRRVLALSLVIACGASLHYALTQNKQNVEIWALRLVRKRFFERGGISNQPQLSSTFNLQGSTRRVLRIDGALNDGHLRAAAFDEYFGGRWSPTLDSRQKNPFPETAAPHSKTTHVARITKLDDLDKLIVAPLNSVAIIPMPGSSFEWLETLGPLHCEDAAPYTYEVQWSDEGSELGVPLHQGVLCAPPSPAQRARLLQVAPEVDARVHALAVKITAKAFDAPGKIEAICDYLLTHHKYARTTRRGRGDPVSSFLLEKKNAHCEYFASAAVILLRCAGIPARYATGYLAHEREGEQTVVRSRDAHAWAEAYVKDGGWITVDATPADGTPEAQPKVSWFQRTWEEVQDKIAKARERFAGFSRTQIFGFIVFVALAWCAEKWRQARRKKLLDARQEYSAHAELSQLAQRFQSLLEKRKFALPDEKPWSELPDEYALAPEYSAFITRYNRARFGGGLNAETLHELQQLLLQLEKGNGHDNNADNGKLSASKRQAHE
jgi:transglutaminase-like putative cysteine protease